MTRILLISEFFPTDLRTSVFGAFRRLGMFIEALKSIGHLDMLFYVSPDTDTSPAAVSTMESRLSSHWTARLSLFLCPVLQSRRQLRLTERLLLAGRCVLSGTVSFFPQRVSLRTSGTRQVRAFEELLDREPDLIFAHTLGAMCPVLLSRRPLPPVFLDLVDLEHVKLRRYASRASDWRRKLSSLPLQRVLLRGEYRSIRLARRTFVCSDLDRDRLMRRWPLSRIVTLPNAVSMPSLEPLPAAPTLLFLGTFNYWPNVDAVEFLIRDVWPRVRSVIPEARLRIAGLHPEKIPLNRIFPGVEFLGFVDDLAALYRESRVVCCPIRMGGGTRIKILEAAAFGRPIVATTIAAEGLDMAEGRELLIRDDAASYATACLNLLRDPVLCEQLASAARAKVEDQYDRGPMVARIERQIREALSIDQRS